MHRLILFLFIIISARSQDNKSELIREIFKDKPQNNSSTPSKPSFEDNSRNNVSDIIREEFEDKIQSSVDQNNRGRQNTKQDANSDGNSSCTTETGEAGRCVESYFCDGGLVAGGIDLHVSPDPCPQQLETCCPLAAISVADADEKPVERPGCGWRNPNGVGPRLVGLTDGETNYAEFPWIVAILRTEPVDENGPGNRREVYVGGGSLIHPSVVLTTAHNVPETSGLRARAGEWDTRTDSEPHPPQERDVVEVKVHEDYISGTLYYDVAVLFLESPMNLAPNVGVVCLPPPNVQPRPSTRCFAAGWGKDQFGRSERRHVILKKTELPLVDRNTCLKKLRSTRLGNLFELHSSFMCAGGEPQNDICRGDSGSPLVCPIEFEENRYQQNGIVAWGVGCGQDGTPGVYVDVARVRNWIDNAVVGKIFDPKVYTA